MARITEDQYKIKDLELKASIAKSLNLITHILAYKFGPTDLDILNKSTEVINNGIKGSSN